MRVVNRTDQARDDIAAALSYLGQRSATAAGRLADQLEDKCRLLAANPFTGRARDEIAPGLRTVVVGNYVLLYTVTDTEVIVVRFIYGRRNLIAAFSNPP
jgi:toxin ParE1/3/4